MQLNTQYLRKLETLTVSGSNITVTFKNAPRFEGDIAQLGEHTKTVKNISFLSSTKDGAKVGVFPVFIPTNEQQRTVLSALIGSPVVAGDCYTFGSVPGARAFAAHLTKCGVRYSKENNFALGHTEPAAQAQPEAQEQADLSM